MGDRPARPSLIEQVLNQKRLVCQSKHVFLSFTYSGLLCIFLDVLIYPFPLFLAVVSAEESWSYQLFTAATTFADHTEPHSDPAQLLKRIKHNHVLQTFQMGNIVYWNGDCQHLWLEASAALGYFMSDLKYCSHHEAVSSAKSTVSKCIWANIL